jgi:hypothetical protein
MIELTIGDIDAMCDVLAQLEEASDSLDLDQAIAFKAAVGRVVAKAQSTLGLLRSQAIATISDTPDRAVVRGGRVYAVKDTGKWRPDQNLVRRVVATKAVAAGEDGEMVSAFEAAARAVDMMYSLYVAPKDMPKATGLESLGLEKSDVAHWEKTGTELEEKPL